MYVYMHVSLRVISFVHMQRIVIVIAGYDVSRLSRTVPTEICLVVRLIYVWQAEDRLTLIFHGLLHSIPPAIRKSYVYNCVSLLQNGKTSAEIRHVPNVSIVVNNWLFGRDASPSGACRSFNGYEIFVASCNDRLQIDRCLGRIRADNITRNYNASGAK